MKPKSNGVTNTAISDDTAVMLTLKPVSAPALCVSMLLRAPDTIHSMTLLYVTICMH
jgi:hypothetical protein